MGTKITKSNAKSAIKDDKAHIDYLKRDVKDDQYGGGKYKDINQTADEIHISKLAGDIKGDRSFLSKHWVHSSPLNQLGDYEGGPLQVGSNEPIDHVTLGAAQTDKLEGYLDEIPDKKVIPQSSTKEKVVNEEKVIQPGDSTETMAETFRVTDEANKALAGGRPKEESVLPSIEVVSGEVDGVAYGAADVDGHIAVDTATVGYDDTMNLP